MKHSRKDAAGDPWNELGGVLDCLGVEDIARCLRVFRIYENLLRRWNARMNLISRRDQDRICQRHFLDSLALAPILLSARPGKLLDLGSGAGFPGMPLHIILPEWDVTLVDSARKKCLFLRKLIQELGVEDVKVVCDRVESVVFKEQYRGQFDLVVTRAVSSLETLWSYGHGLVAQKGAVVAQKGPDVIQEVESVAPHCWVRILEYPEMLPENLRRGRIVTMRKRSPLLENERG